MVLALPAPFSATTSKLKWTDSTGQSIPLIFSGKQAAMTWQALGGQRFSIVGSGGLGAGTVRAKGENEGQNVISRVTFAYGAPPVVTSGDVAAVTRSLRAWRVDTVVLPDQPELPEYDQVASVPDMAALITLATGTHPVHTADAWVWNHVRGTTPTVALSADQFESCTSDSAGSVSVTHVVNCLLQAARS